MELSTSLNLATLVAFVIGSFATFRVAKLITQDVIFDRPRMWTIAKLVVSEDEGVREKGFRVKLAYLLGCPVCCGVWLSLVFTCLLASSWPWDLGVVGLMLWVSIAGAQLSLQQAGSSSLAKG